MRHSLKLTLSGYTEMIPLTLKEVQSLLNEYANRQEIEEIRFIDKDQIIMATAKISSHNMINQKVNDNSVQKPYR